MSLFDDALAAARQAVTDTYAVPMTLTAIAANGRYKAGAPDPSRPPLTIPGIFHAFAAGHHGRDGAGAQREGVERSDGSRPGARFGADMIAGEEKVSFNTDDLAGWLPPDGTLIDVPGRGRYRVLQSLPANAGRQFFYVTDQGT